MGIVTNMEPTFHLAWPPWIPPSGDGVIAVVGNASLTRGWATALLVRMPQKRYVWSRASAACEIRGIEIVNRPGVLAATVAPAGADPRHLALALDVSCSIRQQRINEGLPARACLTSSAPPTPPSGTLRVPHMVTVRHGSGLVADTVVWEILPQQVAEEWLGGRVCDRDRQFVERELEAIVHLRGLVREGELPPTSAAARLLSLMPRGRDLPIELVYRRPDLLRALLPTAAGPARSLRAELPWQL